MNQTLRYLSLLACTLFLGIPCSKAQLIAIDYPCHPQLAIHEKYNYNSQNWDAEWQFMYQYNPNGSVAQEIQEERAGVTWEPFARRTYAYSGNDTITTVESWNVNVWELDIRTTSNYDSLGNQILLKEEGYQNGTWVTNSETIATFTYDSLGRQESLELQGNFLGLTFFVLQEFIYGPGGTPDTIYLSQSTGGVYQPVSRQVNITWHSFSDRLFSEYTTELYSFGAYDPYEKYNYTYYGEPGTFEEITQLKTTNGWENYQRRVEEYDAEGRSTLLENDEWINMVLQVQNKISLVYQEDGQNCLTEAVQTTVTPQDSVIERVRLSNNFVGTPEPADENWLKIYPNPAKDQIFLQLSTDRPEKATVKIYDLKGQLELEKNIQMTSGAARLEIDQILSPGIYLIHLQTRDEQITRRLFIE